MEKYKRINFDTSNLPFSAVMANGKSYTIPRFQRDYSWDADNWHELWDDIMYMRKQKAQHFMGYILLQKDDVNSFKVIDGQQRLTTLTIIILAVMRKLKLLIEQNHDKDGNEERLKNYHRTYIGVFNPVTVTTTPKLMLNRHNNKHFSTVIDRLDEVNQLNALYTNRQINKAFKYFSNQLSDIQTGEELAEITESIVNGLMFTVITVDDDLNAYTIFETLNARGIHLSIPDMLKNFMLSTMAGNGKFTDDDFDNFDERWGGVLEQLGVTKFTNFLRSQQGMEGKLPHKKDLYRTLKEQINQAETVFPYLQKLEIAAPIYAALQQPENEFWRTIENGRYQEVKPYLDALDIFNIKTPLSLLMSGYFNFGAEDFIKLLQYVVAVTIRYNVICKKSPNEQELLYNKISNQVCNGLSVSDVANRLEPIYPKNTEFENSFIFKSMPSRRSPKSVMFLLRSIESHVGTLDPSTPLTLEHILPYNADDSWQEYFGNEYVEQAIDRLGNMALLSESKNMGQENFAEKRDTLQKSSYKINQNIAKYEEWNMANLKRHQEWLAKKAKTIWKISQLEQ